MYPWYQWLAFFYIYCILGWVWESAVVSISEKRFVNRGFLRGPFIPLYGSGAIIMLLLALPVREHLLLAYWMGVIGCTLLELVTGWAMERIFRVRYWDYSAHRLQYHGYIWVVSSLCWGLLTLAMVCGFHTPIAALVTRLPKALVLATEAAVSCCLMIDCIHSTRAALDLRTLLARAEQLHADMEALQAQLNQRLETRIDTARAQLEAQRSQLQAHREESLEAMQLRLRTLQAQHRQHMQAIRGNHARLRQRHPSLRIATALEKHLHPEHKK